MMMGAKPRVGVVSFFVGLFVVLFLFFRDEKKQPKDGGKMEKVEVAVFFSKADFQNSKKRYWKLHPSGELFWRVLNLALRVIFCG